MSILADLQTELTRDVVNQCREKVNVLGEDRGVLHAQDTGAFELVILAIEVQLTAAFGLPLIGSVDIFGTRARERNRNDGAFAAGFRS